MERKRYNIASEVLLLLFAIIEIIAKAKIQSENFANAVIAGSGLLCLIHTILHYSFIRRRLLQIGVIFSLLLLVNVVATGNSSSSHLLWIWGYLGFAALFYSNGLSNRVSTVIYIIYTLFFCYSAFTGLETDADELLISGSSNNISTMYIFGISLYYITKYRENPLTNMPYMPILVLGMLSIWAANRSGVLCTIFLASLIITYNTMKTGKAFVRNILLVAVFSIGIYIFFDVFMDQFGISFLQKENRTGTESTRTLIWAQYIQACLNDPMYILLGVPSSDSTVFWFHLYNGNAHNAFFMLHSNFGIVGLIIIIIAVVKFYIYSFRRKMYPIAIIFSAIVLRSMFDWTGFCGIFDVFFWYIMFETSIQGIYKSVK